MILPINDKYRIYADESCWMLQKYISKKSGWKIIKYCPTLESAVSYLSQLMLRTSDAQTLDEALKEVDRICRLLTNALNPEYKLILNAQVSHG